MKGKNARQNVQQVCNELEQCKSQLTQAVSTVEKPQNKQQIQQTLNAVENACQQAKNTLDNYQE
ncbi:hypothetical protein [Clostridium sp. DL1XJH146]